MHEDLIYRLKERARIRRQIPTRKSVQEGQPDRIADLLEEAALALSKNKLSEVVGTLDIERFRGLDSMTNHSFHYYGNLPDGTYMLYTKIPDLKEPNDKGEV
jgi:hypothetical protein